MTGGRSGRRSGSRSPGVPPPAPSFVPPPPLPATLRVPLARPTKNLQPISSQRTGRPSRYDFHAASPITSGARPSLAETGDGPPLVDVADERLPLLDVARDVAVEEEVRNRLADRAGRGAAHAGVAQRVLRRGHAAGSEGLDSLVVAVHGLAAVVDRGDAAVLVRSTTTAVSTSPASPIAGSTRTAAWA